MATVHAEEVAVKYSLRLALLVVSLFLVLSASAQAGIVKLGRPAPFGTGPLPTPLPNALTLISVAAPTGQSLVSPVDGTIVRWQFTGFVGGPLYLRVLTPFAGSVYLGGPASAGQIPIGTFTQTFATDLPIKAGQTIGIETTGDKDEVGFFSEAGGSSKSIFPPLRDGESRASGPGGDGLVFAYSAEVQPVPAITSVGPTTGSTTEKTRVTILGSDFEGATEVRFGPAPASSFVVDSEGQISAIAPAEPPGSVPVTVTTPGGTAASPSPFTYPAPNPAAAPVGPVATVSTCTVPKLRGRDLGGAKHAVRNAGCAVGSLTKREGATAKTGEVIKQVPKPGALVPAGTKVKFTLAP